ncbi:reverse transcriptase family protein [Pseudoxanthomonas mexicana]
MSSGCCETLRSRTGRSLIVRQAKGGGRFRLIYMPSDEYRGELALCKLELEQILDKRMTHCADHAFVRGRNCVSNADAHIGKRYVLSLDIIDFFDSIRRSSLSDLLSDDLLFWVLEDGAPRQGLPTSPLVANIAMLDVDRRVRNLCNALGDISYSRYADDLAFGFDDIGILDTLKQGIEIILGSQGLSLCTHKTRIQDAKNGVVHIAGVAIDHKGVRATRSTLRRLRAARHQGNVNQSAGLAEWAACRYPKPVK